MFNMRRTIRRWIPAFAGMSGARVRVNSLVEKQITAPRFPEEATIGAALRAAAAEFANSETPVLDARVLMKFATGLDDANLIARGDAMLTQKQREVFFGAVARRARGEPVAYITGVKEFWSLEFRVTPDVLIPRADSECLIEAVLARREKNAPLRILDLGTGSGCLVCALLSELPAAMGIGVDRSPAAVMLARANAARLGFAQRSAFLAGDWAQALSERFDVVIANPPYIRARAQAGLAPDVRLYEPAGALYGGPDGLDACRAILKGLARVTAPDGLVVLECGWDQAGALAEMVSKSLPARTVEIINDLKGRSRGVLADGRPSKKD